MRRSWTDRHLRLVGTVAALALLAAALLESVPRPGSAEPQMVTAGRQFSAARLQRVGDYLASEIAAGKIPGAVILVQQHGKPVYSQSLGVRDVVTRTPMTADTIFRIYSMSKPITSVATMMLVDERQVVARRSPEQYIPAVADVKVAVEQGAACDRAAAAPDHDRGPAAAHVGDHLWLLWRQPDPEALRESGPVRERCRQRQLR